MTPTDRRGLNVALGHALDDANDLYARYLEESITGGQLSTQLAAVTQRQRLAGQIRAAEATIRLNVNADVPLAKLVRA